MIRILFLVLFTVLASLPAVSEPRVGEPAPDFELTDSSGKIYKLSDFRGQQAVVLEFFRSGDW